MFLVTFSAVLIAVVAVAYLLIKFGIPFYTRWRTYCARLAEVEDRHERARKAREELLVCLGVLSL